MKEYDDLLKGVKTFLKEFHFSKKGANFIRESDNFYEVINFRRDKYSTKEESLFSVNVGVISKKILEHRNFKFFNNLMHNQWQKNLSDLVGRNDFWITVNNTVDADALLDQIKAEFTHFVLPKLQQHSNELYIVEKLWVSIQNGTILPFNTAEDLLILVVKSFPEKIEEAAALINSKIKDSNDKLFLAELMRELAINQ